MSSFRRRRRRAAGAAPLVDVAVHPLPFSDGHDLVEDLPAGQRNVSIYTTGPGVARWLREHGKADLLSSRWGLGARSAQVDNNLSRRDWVTVRIHSGPRVGRGPVERGRGLPPRIAPPRALKAAFDFSSLPFRLPVNVAVCMARRVRRRVMFALKLSRRGAGARRRRMTFQSLVRC